MGQPEEELQSLGGFDARTNALHHHSRDPTPWGYLRFACLLRSQALMCASCRRIKIASTMAEIPDLSTWWSEEELEPCPQCGERKLMPASLDLDGMEMRVCLTCGVILQTDTAV